MNSDRPHIDTQPEKNNHTGWEKQSKEMLKIREDVDILRKEFLDILDAAGFEHGMSLQYWSQKLCPEYINLVKTHLKSAPIKGDIFHCAAYYALIPSTPMDGEKLCTDLEGDLSVVQFLKKKIKDLKEHVELREEIESKVFALRDNLAQQFLKKGFDAKAARLKVGEIVADYQSLALSEGITEKMLAKSVAFHALIGSSITEINSIELPVGTKTDLSVIIYLEDQIEKLKS